MSEHDMEELSLWHDILEDAYNGHDEGLKCPVADCGGPVEAEVDEFQIRVQCTKCGKWVEAQKW